MRVAAIVLAVGCAAGAAQARDPATPAAMTAAVVQLPAPPSHAANPYRIRTAVTPADPRFRVDHPRSMLRTGYGGSMIDLFPFEGGKFHLSGGGRLFGRAGRPRSTTTELETLRYLPAFRAGGLRGGRRFSPALLVGYGRTVDRGLALGIDAGVMMGRIGAAPDRFGHLNRRRLDSIDGRGRHFGPNQIARVTALYRF